MVWWKRRWHWINTKEIGDGMQVLRIHERDIFSFPCDMTWYVRGMSIFQDFDETSGNMKTYLYRFGTDA